MSYVDLLEEFLDAFQAFHLPDLWIDRCRREEAGYWENSFSSSTKCHGCGDWKHWTRMCCQCCSQRAPLPLWLCRSFPYQKSKAFGQVNLAGKNWSEMLVKPADGNHPPTWKPIKGQITIADIPTFFRYNQANGCWNEALISPRDEDKLWELMNSDFQVSTVTWAMGHLFGLNMMLETTLWFGWQQRMSRTSSILRGAERLLIYCAWDQSTTSNPKTHMFYTSFYR